MVHSNEDLMCRLCMKSDDVILSDVFKEDVDDTNQGAQLPLPLKVMACIDIEIDPDDNLSHYLCHRCAYKVDSYYDFKEKCKQVDVILRESIRKQAVEKQLQEEVDSGDASDEMENEDEQAVLLVPILNGSSRPDNLKDPLALSDSEINSTLVVDKKPLDIVQDQIDTVIRVQRENFNKVRETRKEQPAFIDIEKSIKEQRETFKNKGANANKRADANKPSKPVKPVKEPFKVPEVINAISAGGSVEVASSTSSVRSSPLRTYCRRCHRSFPNEEFAVHMQAHQKRYKRIGCGPRKMYCCVLCAKIFFLRRSLQRHMLNHQNNELKYNKGLHVCPVCKKCYTAGYSLKRHMIIHSGIRPFRCHICKRNFSDRSNLIKHERIHYPAKPFTCTICSAQFQFKSYLVKHLRQHVDVKMKNQVPDHDCYTKKLKPHEELAMLMSSSNALHEEKLSRTLQITSAEESGEDKTAPTNTEDQTNPVPSVSQHQDATKGKKKTTTKKQPEGVEMESNATNSWFSCRNCHTVCPTYKQLVEHRKIHSGVSGFRCATCKSLFQSQSALTRHVSTSHFKCKACNKVFANKKLSKKHEQLHNRNVCGMCNRTFLSIDGLSKHMVKHNLQSPFRCVLCQDEFATRSVLEMHFKLCCKKKSNK